MIRSALTCKTAISAALGMVAARELSGENLQSGRDRRRRFHDRRMVYEGMNNAGIMKKDLIVVLNDNNMSIAPNVWAISNYFTELIAHPSYNRFKKNVYELTGKLDVWGDRLRRVASRWKKASRSS